MTSNIGITRAHTNIALIKYWGKENKELFIPMNSSLSLTLEAFYTDTKVELTDALTEDEFYLNGAKQDEAATAKITRFLDLFRAETGDTRRARVESLNFVPTAAGLASSASAFAALAGAMNEATSLHMPAQKLSTYARRGSGSATRSLFGGFVEWNKGDSNENSMAIPVDDAKFDIGMIIIVVSAAEKKISSRAGMELTVSTSPFYEGWVTSAATDLADIKEAIKDRDIHRIGSIAEFNGMKMHATMLASNPPFCYFEPESIIAQQTIRTIREERGIPAYFTMDAGPNVKVICKASDIPAILEELGKVFPSEKLIPTLPGEGIRLLTEDEWNASRDAFEGK